MPAKQPPRAALLFAAAGLAFAAAPDRRNVSTASVIPDEGCSDQPYIDTTAPETEARGGQQVVSRRSTGLGKTWPAPVDIGPSHGPESSVSQQLVLTHLVDLPFGRARLRHATRTVGDVESRLSRYFDTSVFAIPPTFTFGNTQRTLPDVRSPGRRNYNFNLGKAFAVRESMPLNFRAEASNLTNTPYFYGPAGGLGSDNFGVIPAALGDRQMQLALKLLF